MKSEVVAEPTIGIVRFGPMEHRNNLPPISAVLTLPSLMTSNVALAMLLAMLSSLDVIVRKPFPPERKRVYPRWRSIIVALRTMAVGLARLVPMMELATWRQPGSNKAYS